MSQFKRRRSPVILSRGLMRHVALWLGLLFCEHAVAQVQDAFDGGRPRWRLEVVEAQAQQIRHEIDLQGGRFGTPAERVEFFVSEGARVPLIYPLSPVTILEDLQVQLWLRAPRPCGPLSVRVRFPKVSDPETGETLSTIVGAETYQNVGDWQLVTVTDVPRGLRQRFIALRSEYGGNVDLSDAYIDAIVLNGFQNMGLNQIWLEDLNILGHVPQSIAEAQPMPLKRQMDGEPFAAGRYLCMIEYHGEPMDWLRQLGVDAIVLSRPPSDQQLRTAAETAMKLICPPMPYVREDWQQQLNSILAWKYPLPVDLTQLSAAQESANACRRLPKVWQRPFMMTVREGWREAAITSDFLVRELPSPYRNLSSSELIDSVVESQQAVGRPAKWLVSLELSAPHELIQQLDAIANQVGAPIVESYEWHAPWVQSMVALRLMPRGFLFRSPTPLDSGRPADQQRAAILRMITRWLKSIEPLAAGSSLGPTIPVSLPDYNGFSLTHPDAVLVILTAQSGTTSSPRAGEGRVLDVNTPVQMRDPVVLRLTGPTPERLAMNTNNGSSTFSIVSPDLVEVVVLTERPESLGQFLPRWRNMISPAITDRWQLVYEDLTALRATTQSIPLADPHANLSIPMLAIAANQLTDAQIAIQANDWIRASSLIRRADAFQMRTRQSLVQRLLPADATLAGLPILQAPGALHLHLTWPPAMRGGHWQPLVVPGAGFEDLTKVQQAGWTHDRRLEEVSNVTVDLLQKQFDSKAAQTGAIRIAAWPKTGQRLQGGYSGTTLRVRSPIIEGVDGRWVKVQVAARVPLGFSGPEQGVLIYDNIGGAALGQLIRGGGESQSVTMFRFVPANQKLQLFFEVLGAGEALIEQVTVSNWRMNQHPLPLPRVAIEGF